MKIVILDYFTLNPGDLDDSALKQLGEVFTYDRTSESQIIDRAQDAEIVLTNKVHLDAETIASLPGLKFIGVLATGTNIIDLDAATKHGITVCNIPAYSTESVAQMVFAHILNHTQQVSLHDDLVKRGNWDCCEDFTFRASNLFSLKNKKMGIIGFGETGKQVANIARAFGMRVLIHSRTQPESLSEGYEWCSQEDLFKASDMISLHCPLTPVTDKLINEQSIKLMKRGALLINCGRGGLVDEQALADSLNANLLHAGVDVLSTEPPAKDNPLLTAKNITITPHTAWSTVEARRRLLEITVKNISEFLNGNTINCVN
ncbi:glycerate dehydrogenase [Shewanella sp. OPT22]|nr:glycerate dehydrogenase [Shewanella sp. OPT22]